MKIKVSMMPGADKTLDEGSKDTATGGYEDYEVDCAASDLLRAEEVKQDPELFKLAMDKLQSKKKAITSIEDLRAKSKSMDQVPS